MIRVVVHDIGTVTADAVLRPADAQLEPASPIALRLDAVAGPDFALLRRVRDPLRCGAVVVTGGGALAAPFVLHCVMQDADARADRGKVRRILDAAWLQAEAWGLTHLAAAPLGPDGELVDLREAIEMLCESWMMARGPAGRTLTIVLERPEDEVVAAAVVARRGAA